MNWRRGRFGFGGLAIGLDIVSPTRKMSTDSDHAQVLGLTAWARSAVFRFTHAPKCLNVSQAHSPTASETSRPRREAPPDALGHFKRFATDVDAVSASYSYFSALIGSTRDARSAGMKPAQSATSASATTERASTAGSAPVI